MRLIEGLSIGIAAMRANKMRSLLTMLGIIIGIAAVLAMIAIGDGAKEIVIQDAQKMGGATRITLYQTSYKRENNKWVRIRSNEYMEYEDVLAIEAECPSVRSHRELRIGEAYCFRVPGALKPAQAITA